MMFRDRKSIVIGIDFDGTITNDTEYPKIAPLKDNAKEVINFLYDRGHTIIIWTCRGGKPLQAAKDFLDKNEIKYHAMNKNHKNCYWRSYPKIATEVTIDDRNLMAPEVNWLKIKEKILKLEKGDNIHGE